MVVGAVAVLDLAGEQPAHGLQPRVRVRGDSHPARLRDLVGTVVVDEAPGPDQRAVPLRERPAYPHRARPAERHVARDHDLDGGRRHGCAGHLRGAFLQVAHAPMCNVGGRQEFEKTAGLSPPSGRVPPRSRRTPGPRPPPAPRSSGAGVDHDGRLVEVLRPQRRLDRRRLRTVRVAAGVQGDRADVDARALARLVVTADVEHDLVAVDVGVVVRHRHRQRVVVDLARQEVADHEVVALEDLVHRRRLVDLAGDRHVVVDVERVGVEAAVPADDVERVRGVRHPGPDHARRAAVLDQDVDVLGGSSVEPCATTVRAGRAGRARSTARARAAARSATGSASGARCGCSPRSRRAGCSGWAPSGAWWPAGSRRSRRTGSAGHRRPSRRCRRPTRRTRTRRRWRCGSTARARGR